MQTFQRVRDLGRCMGMLIIYFSLFMIDVDKDGNKVGFQIIRRKRNMF